MIITEVINQSHCFRLGEDEIFTDRNFWDGKYEFFKVFRYFFYCSTKSKFIIWWMVKKILTFLEDWSTVYLKTDSLLAAIHLLLLSKRPPYANSKFVLQTVSKRRGKKKAIKCHIKFQRNWFHKDWV